MNNKTLKHKYKEGDKVKLLWYRLPASIQRSMPKNSVGIIVRLYDSPSTNSCVYGVRLEGISQSPLTFLGSELALYNVKPQNGDLL